METVPIGADGPLLEGVLGPLRAAEDRAIREVFASVNDDLVRVATQIGGRVGWHGSGLELAWFPSGQLAIQSFVEAADAEDHGVSFTVELRPGWFFGPKTGDAAWEIELSVEIDCARVPSHGRHTVFETVDRASTPVDAARCLRDAMTRLVGLATEAPVGEWTQRCAQ